MRQKENSRMIRELHLIEEKLQEIGCKVSVISHPDLWKIVTTGGRVLWLEYFRGSWILLPRHQARNLPQIQKVILLALSSFTKWRSLNSVKTNAIN